jgi:uncharacterized protein
MRVNVARLRRPAAFAAALLVCSALLAAAADFKVPPSPNRWVTDEAGFLAPATVRALDARLAEFERQTGHQVLVYIGRTTGGAPIEDWAVKAFAAWKVGRKGLDDGLVLFIMAEDRTVRIEVGYGLEDRVPDAKAFEVIDEILLPGFRAGGQDAAVSKAVTSLLAMISGGEASAPREESPGPMSRAPSVLNLIFIAIAVVFFLILFITHPALALWLLFSIFTGGRGGGGGGWGGGGFSGGGGRSGGGGASGSW